ncbi:Nif3-like dinuclear metal center hexameric protein [Deferribacterales bacterium RsTz2092]|nr:GTP cyclohydrolase 1 type 2 [Deferribacterales bacterium]
MPNAVPSLDVLATYFESELSDIRVQSSWDFSGRQLYLGNSEVHNICLALDPTADVVKQAIAAKCNLLITHHPLFFTASKGLNVNSIRDKLVVEAIKAGLNIFSYHTNLDMAATGTSNYILKLLSAEDVGMLAHELDAEYLKVEVFVPTDKKEAIIDALASAGCGAIGNYRRCAFSNEGVGTFTPLDGANPYIGAVGRAEQVAESCVSAILPYRLKSAVISAIKETHPYEEPAFNFIRIDSPISYGFGRIGRFNKSVPFGELVERLKDALKLDNVGCNIADYSGDVSKFAVITGSGASLWRSCVEKGVNILITGDLKHHDALDARQAGVCIIDAGHYATERVFMEYLARELMARFNVKAFCADETASIIHI